jgi:hypothetical protein
MITSVLNKNEIETQKELDKMKIPIKKAAKLCKILAKNRKKMHELNK